MGGVNGVSFVEINAWLQCYAGSGLIESLETQKDRNDFVDVIYSLDREYIRLVNDKQSSKSKDSKPKGTKKDG